ncbi:MAG: methyltransferase domain-containing protein [Pseudohongiellaceae bacterium]
MDPNNIQMDIASVEKTYDRYSSFYDIIFGAFFAPGRVEVINQLKFEDDAHILEIGIGTGASLGLYPQKAKITGVDLSEEMLRLSERRAQKSARAVDLYMMNAEKLDFSDNSFSHVVAMYVVSVSPDPAAIVEEMVRVCKPGGEVVILNHFSDDNSLFGKFEKALAPFSSSLGFKPYFPLSKFTEQCRPFSFADCSKTNLLGYWSILKGLKP